MPREPWIFAYGSLIWRPAFAYAERRPGYLRGWVRRFWQGSTDHRGVPGAPGRVATLVAQPGAACWGVAYRIAAGDVESTLGALDVREQGGYARHELAVHGPGDDVMIAAALVYVATPENPNYLGPASPQAIAAQVRSSHGPSGPNIDYVLRLADALRDINAPDDHVFELEGLLRHS